MLILRAKVILVSMMPDYYAAGVFQLRTARAINDALRDAFDIAGKNGKVQIMPYGNITLPIVKTSDEKAYQTA